MRRILIVDDNDENLYYLQALLRAGEYEVAMAKNGTEALESALAHTPALIIADILMPVMDGFTLCRRWRANERLARIPFVFYTATYTDPKDREFGLSVGADEFLVKPLEPDVMLRVVSELLGRKEAGALPDRSAATPENNTYLKEYNAALIRKLEDKLVELEIANQRLSEAEQFVHGVLDNCPLPIVAADVAGRILLVNPAFSACFGYSSMEAVGRVCAELIDPPDVDTESTLLSRLAAGDDVSSPQRSRRRRKDGSVIEVEVFLAPMNIGARATGLFAVYRDITEQRKLEDQLHQAQKLEAIGQLAAGVAHDFNNLLGVMVGYSELIRMTSEPQNRAVRCADQILAACSRASALTKQLLVFSRRQALLPQNLDLDALMESMRGMLRRLTRADIELAVTLDKPVGRILADPTQFEQVVLNLVTNACDAMPRGGNLTLHLSNVDVNDAEARQRPPLRPGEYVRLAVADTGSGMDEKTISRIFEPFFTTKPVGMGTGLGLASVHGIVEQSGGVILVSSRLGEGSRFEVYFPRIRLVPAESSQLAGRGLEGGTETILVAEDEEALRALITEMLSGLGYRVLSAGSAAETAKLIQDTGEHIDLLLTDLVMPKMGGRELSELAWSIRPAIRVLYVSGYDAAQTQMPSNPSRKAGFLAKPFTRQQLASTVRKILGEKRRENPESNRAS